MKKQKPTYDGLEFDSNEEIEFYMWLEEAKENGLIYPFPIYQPKPYKLSPKHTRTELKQLKTKIKKVEKHLLHPHIYTADFQFSLTKQGLEMKLPFINGYTSKAYIVVDIKGAFNQYGGDREFSINQKWVYNTFGDYINKVVPEKLFKSTWCPQAARLTEKTKKVKAKYASCKTIEEFMK